MIPNEQTPGDESRANLIVPVRRQTTPCHGHSDGSEPVLASVSSPFLRGVAIILLSPSITVITTFSWHVGTHYARQAGTRFPWTLYDS